MTELKDIIYRRWKSITDGIYSGELGASKGTDELIDLLVENGVQLRVNHTLLGVSFFVYDKGEYQTSVKNPWG